MEPQNAVEGDGDWGPAKAMDCASTAGLETQLGVFMFSNFIIASCAITAVATTSLFLGSLTPTEAGRLTQRLLKYLLVKVALVGMVVLPHQVQLMHWLPWLAVIGELKMFVGLAKDRLAGLSVSPAAGLSRHARTLCLLLLVLAASGAGMLLLCRQPGQLSWAICLLFGLDMGITAVDAAKAALSCLALLMDEALATNTSIELPATLYGKAVATWEDWQGRGRDAFFYHMELAADVAMHLLTLMHHTYVWVLHGISFHLLDALLLLDTRAVLLSIMKRLRAHKVHAAATTNLDSAFPNADRALLGAECDAECVICRDKMATAKQLPCGHLFHLHCLRAWLQQSGSCSFNCPMCRAPLCVKAPSGSSSSAAAAASGLQGQAAARQLQQWQLQAAGAAAAARRSSPGTSSGLLGTFSFSLSLDESPSGRLGGQQQHLQQRQQQQMTRVDSWEADGLQLQRSLESSGSLAEAGFDALAEAIAASLQLQQQLEQQQQHQDPRSADGSNGSSSSSSSSSAGGSDEPLLAAELLQVASSSSSSGSGSSKNCSECSCGASGHVQIDGSSGGSCCRSQGGNQGSSSSSTGSQHQQPPPLLLHSARSASCGPVMGGRSVACESSSAFAAAAVQQQPHHHSSSSSASWSGSSRVSYLDSLREEAARQDDLAERFYSEKYGDPLADSDGVPASQPALAAAGRMCHKCSRVLVSLISRTPSPTPSAPAEPYTLPATSASAPATPAAAGCAQDAAAAGDAIDCGGAGVGRIVDRPVNSSSGRSRRQQQHCHQRWGHNAVGSSHRSTAAAAAAAAGDDISSSLVRHCCSKHRRRDEQALLLLQKNERPKSSRFVPIATAGAGAARRSNSSDCLTARQPAAASSSSSSLLAAAAAAAASNDRFMRRQALAEKYKSLRLDTAWEPDQPAAAAAAILEGNGVRPAATGGCSTLPASAAGVQEGGGDEGGSDVEQVVGGSSTPPDAGCPDAAAAVVNLITSPREPGRRREGGKWGRRRCVCPEQQQRWHLSP